MKRLEARLFERMDEFKTQDKPGQMRLSFLSAQNFYGMDILPFAVEIAKVTMMIARKLAIDELHITEQALPLDNLDKNFIAADALLTPEGLPTQWPKADVIIGNPPFLGAKLLKPERGPDYVNTLRRAYAEVPGMADYCVYWIRKSHEHLPACTAADPVAGRAGLVGTQNIRNNQSRVGGLDHVAKTGTIVEAVENQPWSGEANVHVSIANWAKTQDATLLPKNRKLWFKIQPSAVGKKVRKRGGGSAAKEYELDVRECEQINSALSDEIDVSQANILSCNTNPQKVFRGQEPGNRGFVLVLSEKEKLVSKDSHSSEVIFPHLVGRDLLTGNGMLTRWVIDFGETDQFKAAAFDAAFDHVRNRVLSKMEQIAARKGERGDDETFVQKFSKPRLEKWWLFRRACVDTVEAISKLKRYIVCSRVTKRPIFEFMAPMVRPDSSLQVFAFEDDYSFAILQSHLHAFWFITKCGKLKSDFRYSAESVFDTFPWAQFEDVLKGQRNLAGGKPDEPGEIGATPGQSTPNSPATRRVAGTSAATSPSITPSGVNSRSDISSGGDVHSSLPPANFSNPSGILSVADIKKIEAVAAAGREVRRVRAEALSKMKGGLRALYRTLELPGANPLKDAHAALDSAVLTAYGFSPKRDLLAQLLTLNQQVAERIEKGDPVTAPGVPKNYPDPKKLVTEDCVRPTKL